MSVITAAFNAEQFLPETILSVIRQSFIDWEMIIVDDGSADETSFIAEEASRDDSRIRVIRQSNLGQSASQNRALRCARGEFLVFLDADDLLSPDALERLVMKMTDFPRAVAAYGEFFYMSENGGRRMPAALYGERIRPEGDVVEQLLVSNFVVAPGSVMCRRSEAVAVGGLGEDLIIGQDWEFWLRLALRGDFVALGGEPVFFYRIREGSVSRAGGKRPKKYKLLKERLFSNPDVLRRFGSKRLVCLERQFEATTYASCGRDALENGRWGDAWRYYLRSTIRRPSKPSSWLLLGVALLRWAPPRLAKRLGMKP